jgi:hypothetical protein
MPAAVLSGAAVALFLGPSIATAGAWPREDGRTFLSFGTEIGADGDSFASLYAERGLPRRLTAVLDAGAASGVGSGPDTGDGSVALTLRLPLDDGTGANRLALSFGGGLALDDDRDLVDAPGLGQARPFARVGAHWGRGIETPFGTGWVGVDALVDLSIPVLAGEGSDTAWKLDATLGVNRTDRLAGILQLQTGSPAAGDSYLRLQATAAWRLGQAVRIETGAVFGLTGDDTQALKIGLWLDF